jgi:hypothetical protein
VSQSPYDGRNFCSAPGQLYVGGYYRATGGPPVAAATVTATVPANLTSAGGDTISFANISWTSSGIGDSGAQPFPSGSFVAGGVQTVGSMARNTWNESCWSFQYQNGIVPAAGTFNGRVTYTMTTP